MNSFICQVMTRFGPRLRIMRMASTIVWTADTWVTQRGRCMSTWSLSTWFQRDTCAPLTRAAKFVEPRMPSDLIWSEFMGHQRFREDKFIESLLKYCLSFYWIVLFHFVDVETELNSNMMKDINGVWKCLLCDYSSRNSGHVKQHLESKHLSVIYSCLYCSKTCPTKNALSKHTFRAHGKQN